MISRETRLLLATIAISAAVVLILSTLRFPESPRLNEAPPAPLERLAASAAYDQLARIVDRVARRVRPDIIVVRSSGETAHLPRTLSDVLARPLTAGSTRHYPALRIDDMHAVLAADVSSHALTLVSDSPVPVRVQADDPLRQLALLDVPPAATSVSALTLSALQTPTYVVVAEGTAAGIAFRPVFVGSADRFSDPRWGRPLLAVSGTALTSAGALVFSLEGQFIGAAVVAQDGTFAVAGAAELLAAAEELSAASVPAARDFGITVQVLDEATGRALNAARGLVVVSVDPQGLAAGALQPFDIVTHIDDIAVSEPADLLLRLARTRGEHGARLRGVRDGEPQVWTVPAVEEAATEGRGQALALERVTGVGSRVRFVRGGSAAALAGLRPGDVIVRAAKVLAPTPAQLAPLLRAAAEDNPVALIVRRDSMDRVVTVAAPVGEL